MRSRFARYRDTAEGDWGSLHIVLADGNTERHHVLWCYDQARDNGDDEGAALAAFMLCEMTDAQIERLYRESYTIGADPKDSAATGRSVTSESEEDATDT